MRNKNSCRRLRKSTHLSKITGEAEVILSFKDPQSFPALCRQQNEEGGNVSKGMTRIRLKEYQTKLTSIKSPTTKGQPSLGARHSFSSSKSNSLPNVKKCAKREFK